VLRFDVVLPAVTDSPPLPSSFYSLPPTNTQVAATRVWRFERQNGAWAVNQEFFDCEDVRAQPKQGTAEIWVFQNNSGGWQHPIHIHFEEFQILSRNGQSPPANEIGRKDVVRLGFNEEIRGFQRFRDFTGRYPMHCHNTVHEDHAMMIRFDIVP
jgi:FtsP/CotA-like multicopper oxidase with cupredoxin domain